MFVADFSKYKHEAQASVSERPYTRLRFVLVFLMFLFQGSCTAVAQDIFDQREQSLVGGLRDRALFDLAESHCQKTLQREGLTPTDHASIAIERIRIKTAAARTATDRNVYWLSLIHI